MKSRLAALVLALATAAAVVGLWRGLSLAPDCADRLRDDAFYEFAWAANVAAGLGPTVSDGVTTSGVQVLWSALLVPFAWCFGAAALPLIAPWLGLLLHALAAFAIAAGSWARDRVAGVAVALCWLGNPLLVREAQNGQETALACLLLLLLWQHRRVAESRFVGLGVLAVLARTDLFGVVLLLALWRWRRHGAAAAVTPIAALASLFSLNAVLGGGLLADSAAPMAWLWHSNHAATDPTAAATVARYWWYLRPVLLGGPWALASAFGSALAVFLVVRPLWPRRWRVLPPLIVASAALLGARDLMVAGWLAIGLSLWPAAGRRRVPLDLAALLLGCAAILVLHWAVRWYPRDYYIAPLVVPAIAALLRLARLRWLLVLFCAAQLYDGDRVRPEPLAGQRAMALAGQHLATVLRAGERVGCFNSGLVTFGADVLRRGTPQRRAVVNLDGVVDARAFAALRRGQLSDWLDEQGIRFVLDNPVQFARDPRLPHANGLWFAADFDPDRDLVESARFVAPVAANARAGSDSFRLYWRRGRGAGPDSPPANGARDLGATMGGRAVWWSARAGQQLEIETDAGGRALVARVEVTTIVIVYVARERLGTGRLFVAGEPEPVLTLPRL